MSQTGQEEAKKDITALINKETQIAIMRFFLQTSVPRILKQKGSEPKALDLEERE